MTDQQLARVVEAKRKELEQNELTNDDAFHYADLASFLTFIKKRKTGFPKTGDEMDTLIKAYLLAEFESGMKAVLKRNRRKDRRTAKKSSRK